MSTVHSLINPEGSRSKAGEGVHAEGQVGAGGCALEKEAHREKEGARQLMSETADEQRQEAKRQRDSREEKIREREMERQRGGSNQTEEDHTKGKKGREERGKAYRGR